MLSPYRLYQADKPLIRNITPTGKAICSSHYKIDWTVHRLIPTVLDRRNPIVQKGINHGTAHAANRIPKNWISVNGAEGRIQAFTPKIHQNLGGVLHETSPRWGGDRPTPLPRKGEAEISRKTMAILGGGAAGGGSVAGYVSRDKLQNHFNKAVQYSHPKYKKKIKRGTYTQYVY